MDESYVIEGGRRRNRAGLTKIVLAALAAAGLCASAGAATGARNVNLLQTFKPQIAQIKRATTVPVLLPASLPIPDGKLRVYPSGGPDRNGWRLELGSAPSRGAATAS